MTAQAGNTALPSGAVVVADEALRASLILLLEMCGLLATGFSEPDELLNSSGADERFIFIDSTPKARRAIGQLRHRGWNGMAVVMTEGELASGKNMVEGPHRILPKPFSSDEVLSILHK